ncbi:MAG TPA: hypothetical protein VNU26_15560 [Mycobacteriales bacterium]|nr:hypothetical protein [Mycobacteriales bacterium]
MRTCTAGAALAALAGILVTHGGGVFGNDFTPAVVLGIALGAALGLVPHGTPLLRVAGFGAGFLAAWAGYGARALVLPDTDLGRGLAAVFVLALVTAVATASADRVPLWTGLLGVGALVGAYEAGYTAAPTDAAGASVVAATSVLLAVVVGFVVTNLIASLPAQTGRARGHATGDASTADQDLSFLEQTLPGSTTGTTPVPGPRVTSDVPTSSETTR